MGRGEEKTLTGNSIASGTEEEKDYD